MQFTGNVMADCRGAGRGGAERGRVGCIKMTAYRHSCYSPQRAADEVCMSCRHTAQPGSSSQQPNSGGLPAMEGQDIFDVDLPLS